MAVTQSTFPELAKGLSFAIGAKHTIKVRTSERVRLVGMFFDLDKSFLLPSSMHGIREVKELYDAHPASNLLVVGHTDTSGKDDYNLKLSSERAESVAAYLTDDVDAWEKSFHNPAQEKCWGTKEIQAMLSALPEGGPPFFAGEPNGRNDAATTAAVKKFQTQNGLKVDGIAGPDTRKALIGAYMALDGTSLPAGIDVTTHGCGENFPVDGTQDGKRDADNRRVEIFLFDGPITPAPSGPTSAKGATDYPEWLKQVTHNIDVVLGQDSTGARLESRYALERFELLVETMDENAFVAWATLGYGSDIPLDAYRALFKDLTDKKLEPPDIQLVPGGIDGHDSAYDNATRMIGISEELALAAETDDASAGQLAALLMHEFGHHVDTLLRKHYSQVGGDAPGEEGALFAYGVTAEEHVDETGFTFATLTHDGQSIDLALEYSDFHDAATQYLADPAQQDDAKRETVEFFSAGRGGKNKQFPNDSFGHQSIEDGLGDADPVFFSNTAPTRIRDQIYFGNWLRDYSQFLDPSWMQAFQNPIIKKGKKAREVMTEYLDLMAKSEFEPGATPTAHVAGVFHVTLANCGVYRAEEHIDNPKGILNGSAIDPLFHGPIAPGELDVDPNTGLKAYIATSGKGFATATAFVEKSFRAAVATGFTPEGRRLFGQGLHTIEDLFAHSNFIELCLIRLGHKSVHPWVGEKARITVIRNGNPVPRIPMVTGTFGSVDTAVSAASAIGESLEKEIECETGIFSKGSIVAIDFTKILTDDGGQALESLFTQLKKLESKYPEYATFMCKQTKPILDKLRATIGALLRDQIKRVDQYEKEVLVDPFHTAPSHSMIAKDHDDNPIHAIAARCAREAVKDVGGFMRDAWNGVITPDKLILEALKYFVHPDDIDATQTTGPGLLLAKVKAFADGNPAVLIQLNRANSEARFLRQATASREETLEEARQMYARDETNADRIVELLGIAV